MAEDLRNKATNGIIWSAIERYSLQGVQFLLQLIIARILTPHDYGLIGMLAIFMALSQVFIDGGFSNALIQKKDRSEADYSTVFYINFGISIFIYVLLFFGAPYIASFYDQPLLSPITRVYSINLIINSLAAVNKVKLTVDVDFKTQSKISLGAATISGLAGIACAYYGMGVWALVVQILLNSVINVILSFYYVRWWPKLNFSKESFHRLFKFGNKLLIASIIHSIYENLYNLFIGKQYSSATLGLFTRAQQFTNFAGSNLSAVLKRVSFPLLSQIQDEDERLLAAYKKYIKTSTWATFPLLMGLCGIAKPMVMVLLTEKWINCVPYLQILCFAMLWDGVTQVNLNLLYVKGHSDWVLRLEIIKKSIAFTILFISLGFNMYVICIGKAIYSFIALCLNTHYTKKLFNYGFFAQMKDLLPQLSLSLLMLVFCLLASYLIPNALLAFIASFLIGVIIYMTGSYFLKLYGFEELCQIIKNKNWKQ